MLFLYLIIVLYYWETNYECSFFVFLKVPVVLGLVYFTVNVFIENLFRSSNIAVEKAESSISFLKIEESFRTHLPGQGDLKVIVDDQGFD